MKLIKCLIFKIHDWKYIGFWRNHPDGEYERKCNCCGIQQRTTEFIKGDLIYELSKF